MITPDFIGWVSNVFFVYGVYNIGIKKINGFYHNIVGNLGYVIQGVLLNVPSLVVLSIILILLNIKGVIEWKKK